MLYTILIYLFQFGMLFYIYRKWGREEPYLFLKLFGYSLLGAFAFNLNRWSLPAGFLIFLFFFRDPAWNRTAKHYAAYTGLCVFFAGVITPPVQNYLYERPRTFEAAQKISDVQDFDFVQHWERIENQFGGMINPRLEDLELEFEENGAVEALEYQFKAAGPSEHSSIYSVRLKTEEQEYHVTRDLISPRNQQRFPLNQAGRVAPEGLFNVLNDVEVSSITKQVDSGAYLIRASGVIETFPENSGHAFLITEAGIEPVKEEQLPLDAVRMVLTADGKKAQSLSYAVFYIQSHMLYER